MGDGGDVAVQVRLEGSDEWHSVLKSTNPILKSIRLPACEICAKTKGDNNNATVVIQPYHGSVVTNDPKFFFHKMGFIHQN